MGLKESIEQAHQQVQSEQKIQIQLNKQKAIEVKNRFDFIDQKASQITLPYLNAINQSNCFPILNELIQIEKLTKERDRQPSAKPELEIIFNFSENKPKAYPEKKQILWRGDLKNNFLNINNFITSSWTATNFRGEWNYGREELILNINPQSLCIYSCKIELGWGEYTTDEGHFTEPNIVSHVNHIDLLFKKYNNNFVIEASNDRKKSVNITPKDLDKRTMEKTIAKLYSDYL